MMAAQEKSTQLPNLNQSTPPSSSNVLDTTQVLDEILNVKIDRVPSIDIPPKFALVVIDLDKEKKEEPTSKIEEGAKRLAKIEEV